MNASKLRDALDSFKTDILSRIWPDGGLAAIALRTDTDSNWDPPRWQLYSAITLNDPSKADTRVWQTRFKNSDVERENYFLQANQFSHTQDVFLDPDTGMRSRKFPPTSTKHILVSSALQLMKRTDDQDRVVAVYQHRAPTRKSQNTKGDKWLNQTLGALGLPTSKRVAICGGNVGIVFVSHNAARISDIRSILIGFSDPTNRVF